MEKERRPKPNYRRMLDPFGYVEEGVEWAMLTARYIHTYGWKDGLDRLGEVEEITGMTERAFFGHRIYIPAYDEDGVSQAIQPFTSHGGQMVGLDWLRDQHFPRAFERHDINYTPKGFLSAFMPADIFDVDGTFKTPIPRRDRLSPHFTFSWSKYPIDYLLDYEMITKTTQAEAYASVGLGGLIKHLETYRVAEEPVYQVTPKGNGLVMLTQDSGERQPKEDPVPVLQRLGALGLATV